MWLNLQKLEMRKMWSSQCKPVKLMFFLD